MEIEYKILQILLNFFRSNVRIKSMYCLRKTGNLVWGKGRGDYKGDIDALKSPADDTYGTQLHCRKC